MGTVVWKGAVEEAGYEVGIGFEEEKLDLGMERAKRTGHAMRAVRPGRQSKAHAEQKSNKVGKTSCERSYLLIRFPEG